MTIWWPMPCGHCREIKPFSLLVSLFISLKRLLPHLNKRTHIQRSLEFFVVVFFCTFSHWICCEKMLSWLTSGERRLMWESVERARKITNNNNVAILAEREPLHGRRSSRGECSLSFSSSGSGSVGLGYCPRTPAKSGHFVYLFNPTILLSSHTSNAKVTVQQTNLFLFRCRFSGSPDMNYFVMAVLPSPAWNSKGHLNFYSIGDPPTAAAAAAEVHNSTKEAISSSLPGFTSDERRED